MFFQAQQVMFTHRIYKPALVSDRVEEGYAEEQSDKISAFRGRISCIS